MLIAIFEIVGSFVRYLVMAFINKVFYQKSTSSKKYFSTKNNSVFKEINTDYTNAIIGFLTLFFVLGSLFFLFN